MRDLAMVDGRRRFLRAAVSLSAVALMPMYPVWAADPNGAVALTVRRLRRLPRLTLSPRARQAWARSTLALVDQDVGVFLDGQIQGGITIRSPMAQGLFEFRVHGASKAELQRIATGLMKTPG